MSISGNEENGILCCGKNIGKKVFFYFCYFSRLSYNFTRIENNSFIGYNKRAGVKADEEARIYVHMNKITKNLGQGILLVESSSGIQ